MRIIAILLLTLMPALADEGCPPEAPFARDVIRFDRPVTCNSVLVTRLVCPVESKEPCYSVASSTCPAPPVERQCFTAEQIERATKEK